jgi:hypothetical protein
MRTSLFESVRRRSGNAKQDCLIGYRHIEHTCRERRAQEARSDSKIVCNDGPDSNEHGEDVAYSMWLGRTAMSTSEGPNSLDPKKSLIVVGSELKDSNTDEKSSATASDNAAREIFSKVVLKTESRAAYDSLVSGLRDACQPEGTLEEILVEKLAAILWRYRRLITAESGEIGDNLSSLGRTDVRLKERDRLESEVSRRRESHHGIIGMIHDPGLLSDCLRELQSLSDSIRAYGFSGGTNDEAVLRKLYGREISLSGDIDILRYNRDSLYDTYWKWSRTAKVTDQERQKNPRLATPQQCRDAMIKAIEKEIQRLTEAQTALHESQPEQTEIEQLRRNLPDVDRMERLLRYEASLERAFDRTLAQLERLQEMRLGQPAANPLKRGMPA